MNPWVLALTSAAMVSAAHRPWGVGFLAWIALVPLFVALLRERRVWRGALLGWIASLGTGLVGFEGVIPAEPLAYPPVVAVAGIPMAIVGAMTVLIRRHVGTAPALASLPALILAAEWLPAQRWIFAGFANGMSALGYTQYGTPLRDLAAWSSVTTVSMAVLLLNVAVYLLFTRRRFLAPALLAAGVAVAALIPAPGTQGPAADAEPLRIGLAQGAVSSVDSLMARFDRDAAQRMVDPYAQLTERAMERDADLVLWGETAVPHALRPDHVPDYVAEALEPAPRALVGAVSYVDERSYNSAFYWDGEDLTEVYRKRALVPFNEWHYTPGQALPPLDVDGTAAGMGICLDSVYPQFARQSVRAGAEVLLYITEDSFAQTTVTPELHLRVSAFRAIETGRQTVFANQSGPSAVFDHRGRELARLPYGEAAGTVTAIAPSKGITPFVRFGDWLGALATIVVAAWLVTGVTSLFVRAPTKVEESAQPARP